MTSTKRYIEIDLLRTLAIVMMIVYHTAYDLWAFWGWNLNPFDGGWWLLARATANLFLLLVGISFAISWSRHSDVKRVLRRSALFLGSALVVTIVTYLINPETYVRFGILHVIGVGTILLLIFVTLRAWALLPGIALIALGPIVREQTTRVSLLIPLGIVPPGFMSVDYFPLIPWFGVILIGYAIGYFFYVRTKASLRNKFLILNSQFSILSRPGKHSLFLYLIHQPIIFAILWIMFGKPNI